MVTFLEELNEVELAINNLMNLFTCTQLLIRDDGTFEIISLKEYEIQNKKF